MGQDASQDARVSLYLLGIAVSDLHARGMTVDDVRALVDAQLEKLPALLKQAEDEAVVDAVAGEPEQ